VGIPADAPAVERPFADAVHERRAQHHKIADALCEAENERLSSVGKKLGGVLSKAEATGELGHVAAPMRAFSDEIRTGLAQFEALEPPAAQRDAVAAMIATEAAQVDLFDELAAAFESGDRGTAHAVEARLVRNKKSYGEQTEELGFQVCGVSSR